MSYEFQMALEYGNFTIEELIALADAETENIDKDEEENQLYLSMRKMKNLEKERKS